MMKRLVYIIFALILTVASAQAQTSGQCGDNLTWTFADSTLTITGTGAMYDGAPWEHLKESIAQIRLPQGLTRVGSSAFAGCSHLRSFTIPSSVTSIGYEAFGHLPITTLTIPQGVTLIETYAFANCGSLTSVSLPNTLESLDSYCFQGCSSLTSITIPSSVTYMDQPFLWCSSLTSIVVESGNLVYDSRNNCNAIIETASGKLISGCSTTVIPQGVTSIEGLAFEAQTELTSITFPNTLLRIRGRAFCGCSSLNAITIPSSVQVIEETAFWWCSSLTSIIVESGNNVYDSRNNCNAIIETATNRLIAGCQNTIIPNDVAIIAGSAFRNQSNLTSITIPEGVTTIGDWSFAESGLTSIVIPNSVTNLGWAAFTGCSSLRSVVLPNSLDTIQAEMFVDCPIQSIFLPSSVKHIKNWGFWSTPLSQIYLNSPTPITLETEEVFSSDILTCYIPTGTLQAYQSMPMWQNQRSLINFVEKDFSNKCGDNLYWTLQDSTLTITGSGAMYDYSSSAPVPWTEFRSSIKSLILPEGLTSIGNYAFASCDALIAAAIPSSVKSIGNYAFHGCTSLSQLLIPNGVETIGDYAFYGCFALTTVYAQSLIPPTLGSAAFNSKPACYVPTSTLTTYQSSSWSNFATSFTEQDQKCGDNLYWLYADGVLHIVGSGAMYDMYSYSAPWYSYGSSISSINLPDGITVLGAYAFSYTAIPSIKLPNTIYAINDHAFYECHSLAAVNIPDSLISLGRYTFYGTSIYNDQTNWENNALYVGNCLVTVNTTLSGDYTIRENTKLIADYAFYEQASLASVSIPESVLSIGSYTFAHCRSLTYVFIPQSVKHLYDYAFYYSNKLAFVDLPEGLLSIGKSVFLNCSSLTHITIPSTVTSIGQNAFYNSDNTFKEVYLKPTTAPALGTNAFYSGAICYTPCGAAGSYLASSAWSNQFSGFIEQCDLDNYHTFDSSDLNAQWQFVQNGQTNHWAIGINAGSASISNKALYITHDDNSYAYDSNSASVSWACLPVVLTTTDSISFCWKGEGETCCDYAYAYLIPAGSLPTAGSTTLPEGALTISNKINQQTAWQKVSVMPNVEGNYLLCFMWTNDESNGATSIAIDDVRVGTAAEQSNKCGADLYWELTDGVLAITGSGAMYDYSKVNMIPWYEQRASIIAVSLPSQLTTIGKKAFYECTNLSGSITLPEGVTAVGDSAFYNCQKLSGITFPDSMTYIGARSFYNCDALTSIVIPNNVTIIPSYAFYSAGNLSSVYIGSSVDSIESYAFYNCSSLNYMYVYAQKPPRLASTTSIYSSPICYIPAGSLADYQASSWANLVSAFVEQGQCGDNLYYTIDNGVLNITGSGTMYDYTNQSPAPWFSQRMSIHSVNLPVGVTTIGAWAFYDCDSLTYVYLPSSLAEIKNEAFYDCSYLPSITLPDQVTAIGYEAFASCSRLTSATLGESVSTVAGYAFSYCSALAKIILKSQTPPTLASDVFSNSSAPICYIPCGSSAAYQASSWNTQVSAFEEQCYDNNFYDFEFEIQNQSVQFIQDAQTNYWTIGSAAGSVSPSGTMALYISNNGESYSYSTGYSAVSWAGVPVTLTSTDSISFYWKGTGEGSYDNMRVYLAPVNELPTAGSTSAPTGAQQLTTNYLSGQSSWQRFAVLPRLEGDYNLWFVWKNDASGGQSPIAVDNICIGNAASDPVSNQCGDNLYWQYASGVLTISGFGAMYDFESPEQVPWYSLRSSITSIVLSKAVTHIGNYAFDTSALTSFTFSGADLALNENQDVVYFANTNNWQTVYTYCWNSSGTTSANATWPGVPATKASFTYEGYEVYYYVTAKGEYQNCIFNDGGSVGEQTADLVWTSQHIYNNDTWYALPSGSSQLQSIGNWAFSNCPLNQVELPSMLTTIGEGAFYSTSLTTITIPDSVTLIGASAFAGNDITSVYALPVIPPTLNVSAFTSSPICYVPCGSLEAYETTDWVKYTRAIQEQCDDNPPVSPDYEVDVIMTNLTVDELEEYTLLQASESTYGFSIIFGLYSDGSLHEESMISLNNVELTIASGTLAKTYNAELGTDVYSGLVIVEYNGENVGLNLTMYSQGTPSTYITITDATASINNDQWGYTTLSFSANWENYPVSITLLSFEELAYKEYSGSQICELTIGDENNWFDFAVADAVVVTISNNIISLTGSFTSFSTGSTYVVSISAPYSTTTPEPTPSDYHNFEDAALNAQWQFVQDNQTNYWTIGTSAGSYTDGSNALYITNDGTSYNYNKSSSSVSWAYVPVTLTATDTISFNWKGSGEGSYDYLYAYLAPTDQLPVAGSTTAPAGSVASLGSLKGYNDWQYAAFTPGVSGTYNLWFMWKNDNSSGGTPAAVDNIRIRHLGEYTPSDSCFVITVCYGESYYWSISGNYYNESGTYTCTTANGDTHTLLLTVSPQAVFDTTYVEIANTESYYWHGSYYNQTGEYTYAEQSIHACDSAVHVLMLVVDGMTDTGGNKCGVNLSWTYANGILTISGSGAMYDSYDDISYHAQSWYPAGVTQVNLPSGLTRIGNTAFADCHNLTSISIPTTVTTIGEAAFANTGLRKVELPNSVQNIYYMAFAKCDQMTQFIYRGTPNALGNSHAYLLMGCHNLDTIIAPARIFDCISLDTAIEEAYGVPSHVSYIQVTSGELSESAIDYIARSKNTLHTLNLTNSSNTELPAQAFRECSELEYLYLPTNLSAIPSQMAYGCASLKSITIPAAVRTIADEAFMYASNLQSIDFAGTSSLTSIGQKAFSYCQNLAQVNLPSGLTTIAAYAFRDCSSLVMLHLPSTLSQIEQYAFYNCQNLAKMYVDAYTPPTVQSNTFYAVPRTAHLYVPESVVNDYKGAYVWQEFVVISNLRDGLEDIHVDSTTDVQKFLIDGQIFIIKNGKCYNLMGQEAYL